MIFMVTRCVLRDGQIRYELSRRRRVHDRCLVGLITMDGGKSFRDEKVARASRTGRKWTVVN